MHYIGQSLMVLDHSSCKLKWTASTDGDLAGYNIYMSERDRNDYQRMNEKPLRESEWLSPPLRRDMRYFFYITSVDTSGNESNASNVFAFQLPDAEIDKNLKVAMVTSVELESGLVSISDVTDKNFVTQFELVREVKS